MDHADAECIVNLGGATVADPVAGQPGLTIVVAVCSVNSGALAHGVLDSQTEGVTIAIGNSVII